MIYFSYSTQSFYDRDFDYPSLPDDVVPISDKKYRILLDGMNDGHRVLPNLTLSEPQPSPNHIWQGDMWVLDLDLPMAKTQKLQVINEQAQSYISTAAHLDEVPDFEVQTWTIQAMEAKAWHADNSTPTPTLDTIATARGVPPTILRQKALEKALAFERLSAYVAGVRQRLTDMVEHAKTLDELDAIDIDFNIKEVEA